MLYIVPTPIGNLEDMTIRGIDILKNVDFIIAEDTRHSKILLDKYEIKRPITSFHAHTKDDKVDLLVERLKDEDGALVSDAGTPGISDPGYVLIKKCVEADVNVIPLPGASAVLTALSASGLPTNKFIYHGFLPIKKGRQTLIKSFIDEAKTVVFYESPHRIMKTISQLKEFLGGDRKIVIARELTKIYEEFIRGTIGEVEEELNKKTKIKGEFVVILGGKDI